MIHKTRIKISEGFFAELTMFRNRSYWNLWIEKYEENKEAGTASVSNEFFSTDGATVMALLLAKQNNTMEVL